MSNFTYPENVQNFTSYFQYVNEVTNNTGGLIILTIIFFVTLIAFFSRLRGDDTGLKKSLVLSSITTLMIAIIFWIIGVVTFLYVGLFIFIFGASIAWTFAKSKDQGGL